MTDDTRPERDTPLLSPFAQEMRDRAEKALTTLTVDRAEVEANIAELQGRLESIGSEMAEAQLVIDALSGKLVRPDDEPVRAHWPADMLPQPEGELPPEPAPPTPELESARSEDGGVQPKSDEAPTDSEEGATPDGILPAASGVDARKVVDDAVLEHLAEHPRCRRADIMSALSLTDIAAAQSLSRLVKKGEAKVVAEDPTRWSLADAEAPPKKPEAPEPEPQAEETATVERESRRGGGYLTQEIVRDAAKAMGVKFNARTLAAWMTENLELGEVVPMSLKKYIRDLHGKKVLERSGGKSGPGVKYEYVKPNGGGPTTRPRHDHPRQLPKGTSERTERGEAVPHTGRAKGRAGKSGENKKKQQLGFRVKSARTDRKRAG